MDRMMWSMDCMRIRSMDRMTSCKDHTMSCSMDHRSSCSMACNTTDVRRDGRTVLRLRNR